MLQNHIFGWLSLPLAFSFPTNPIGSQEGFPFVPISCCMSELKLKFTCVLSLWTMENMITYFTMQLANSSWAYR